MVSGHPPRENVSMKDISVNEDESHSDGQRSEPGDDRHRLQGHQAGLQATHTLCIQIITGTLTWTIHHVLIMMVLLGAVIVIHTQPLHDPYHHGAYYQQNYHPPSP